MSGFLRHRPGGLALLAIISVAIASPSASGRPISEDDAVAAALANGQFGALGEAERAVAEARTRSLPRFESPEATVSRESVSGSAGRETEWQVGITQPIQLSGRQSSLRAAARAEAVAVGADVSRRRQQRIAEVREAFVGCAAAAEKIAISLRYARRLAGAERSVTLRTRAGDTAVYDLRRLRVEARSAEAQLHIAEGERAAECGSLGRLTGINDAEPSIPLTQMLPARGEVLQAQPSAVRQDLTAMEARVASAAAEARAAEQSRIPDLSVGVGYKRLSNEDGSAGGPAASLGIRLPLFSRGTAAVDEARARQRVREAELQLARREVQASIGAAAARVKAATAAAYQAREAAMDASRLSAIAQAAYEGGETGVVELIDGYRTARDAELEIVDHTERALRATITQSLAEGR